jgi:hypothetical protein
MGMSVSLILGKSRGVNLLHGSETRCSNAISYEISWPFHDEANSTNPGAFTIKLFTDIIYGFS